MLIETPVIFFQVGNVATYFIYIPRNLLNYDY